MTSVDHITVDPAAFSHDRTGSGMLLSALALIVALPFAGLFVAGASSTTPGLMAACVVLIAAGVLGFYRLEGGRRWGLTVVTIVIVSFGMVLHSVIASLMSTGDILRAIGTLIAAINVVVSAYLLRLIIQQTRPAALDRVIKLLCTAFIVIGIFSLLDIQPPHSGYAKPIFPFTEPSHFALSFTPFLIYRSVRSSLPVRLIWLGAGMILALLLQSLSLVVAVALAAACCLSGWILAVALVGLSAIVGYLDISYFTDRLDFSTHTTNVSTLVYIQGYELIVTALKETWGWGIGFQQLGIVPLNVPTSDLIYRIVGNDANLRDGGFTAAKVISELGFFGILLTTSYFYYFVLSVLKLRRLAVMGSPDSKKVLCFSAVTGIFIEMLVRGGGYFTGTILFAVSAMMVAADEHYFKADTTPAQVDPS